MLAIIRSKLAFPVLIIALLGVGWLQAKHEYELCHGDKACLADLQAYNESHRDEPR